MCQSLTEDFFVYIKETQHCTELDLPEDLLQCQNSVQWWKVRKHSASHRDFMTAGPKHRAGLREHPSTGTATRCATRSTWTKVYSWVSARAIQQLMKIWVDDHNSKAHVQDINLVHRKPHWIPMQFSCTLSWMKGFIPFQCQEEREPAHTITSYWAQAHTEVQMCKGDRPHWSWCRRVALTGISWVCQLASVAARTVRVK